MYLQIQILHAQNHLTKEEIESNIVYLEENVFEKSGGEFYLYDLTDYRLHFGVDNEYWMYDEVSHLFGEHHVGWMSDEGLFIHGKRIEGLDHALVMAIRFFIKE